MARRRRHGRVLPKQGRGGLGPLTPKGFMPWKPPSPPTGSYDPALDAQQRAAQRGLGYLTQDTATGNLRAADDYGLAREDIGRQRTRGLEDYRTETGALQRSYQQLGRRQAEGARASGVLSGGLALQSAQKRAENQGIDQRGLDVSRDRMLQDADLGLGRLDLEYQRGVTDRGTGLTRAKDENTFFGLDIGEQKAYQAAQSGWEAPGMPKNMGVNKKGVQYIERIEGPYVVRYDSKGHVLSRRLRKGFRSVRPGQKGFGGGQYSGAAVGGTIGLGG